VGAVLEGRGWAAVSEVVRLAVLGLAALTLAVMGRGDPPLLAGLALFALASLAWVVSLRRAFSPSSPSVRTA